MKYLFKCICIFKFKTIFNEYLHTMFDETQGRRQEDPNAESFINGINRNQNNRKPWTGTHYKTRVPKTQKPESTGWSYDTHIQKK